MSQVLFVYRCSRCKATFTLTDEEQHDDESEAILEVNPCRVCDKGAVEYVGKLDLD